MAQLQPSKYVSNTLIHSSGSNIVRPPIVSSPETSLSANFNNLIYVTNTNAGDREGDAIQVYYAGGAGYIKYITYGP